MISCIKTSCLLLMLTAAAPLVLAALSSDEPSCCYKSQQFEYRFVYLWDRLDTDPTDSLRFTSELQFVQIDLNKAVLYSE